MNTGPVEVLIIYAMYCVSGSICSQLDIGIENAPVESDSIDSGIICIPCKTKEVLVPSQIVGIWISEVFVGEVPSSAIVSAVSL